MGVQGKDKRNETGKTKSGRGEDEVGAGYLSIYLLFFSAPTWVQHQLCSLGAKF